MSQLSNKQIGRNLLNRYVTNDNINNESSGKKFASGLVTSNTTMEFFDTRNDSVDFYSVTVSGLSFLPSIILLSEGGTGKSNTIYNENNIQNYKILVDYRTRGTEEYVESYGIYKVAPIMITSTQFKLPVTVANKIYKWIAIE